MSSPVAPTTLAEADAADRIDLTKITTIRLWHEIHRRQGSPMFTSPSSLGRYAEEAKRAIQRGDLLEAADSIEHAHPETYGLLRLVQRALDRKG